MSIAETLSILDIPNDKKIVDLHPETASTDIVDKPQVFSSSEEELAFFQEKLVNAADKASKAFYQKMVEGVEGEITKRNRFK